MKAHRNPYSTDLTILRDYLKAGWDIYEYAFQLERFYDEERGSVVPKWFDPEDPQHRIELISKKDKAEFKEWTLRQGEDAMTPATQFF